MGKAAAVGAERIIALGDFILDLQRVGDDSLAGAILVVRGLDRGFDPGKVLLADFHHALGERRHEQPLRDFAAQLLGAVVHFGFAHGGLRFSDAASQLGSSPQWQLLLHCRKRGCRLPTG